MSQRVARAGVVLGVVWALGPQLAAQAQPVSPPMSPPVSAQVFAPVATSISAPDPALVDDGRRRYTGMCARCHGLNLVTTGIGFDLRRFPRDDKERFVRSITKGLKAMPAFEGNIKPVEIEALWAYIGSVNGWLP